LPATGFGWYRRRAVRAAFLLRSGYGCRFGPAGSRPSRSLLTREPRA